MENGKEKARKVAVELIETGIMMNGEQLWMELEGIARKGTTEHRLRCESALKSDPADFAIQR